MDFSVDIQQSDGFAKLIDSRDQHLLEQSLSFNVITHGLQLCGCIVGLLYTESNGMFSGFGDRIEE